MLSPIALSPSCRGIPARRLGAPQDVRDDG